MSRVTFRHIAAAILALVCIPPPVFATDDGPPRIVAVGDVHGSPGAFRAILESAGVLDSDGAWVGGDTVLVQTGDLLDRGTEIRELLDLMRGLESAAAQKGGRLVSLMGNHEVYNLIGFYDYSSTPLSAFTKIAEAFADEKSEKRRKQAYRKWGAWSRRYRGCGSMSREEWVAHHPLGFIEYQEALSVDSEYGQWLRERRVVAEIGDTIFLHGGLSPELVEMGLGSLAEINEAAAEELRQFDEDRATLEREGVALPFSTLGEIYCAMAWEVRDEPPGSISGEAVARKRRLQKIHSRLPSASNWLLLDERGPVWFRGYAKWTEEEAATGLATVFDTFGGSRVVVGHTPQVGNILPRFDGRVFLIDTAMAYAEVSDGRAAALELVGSEAFAIYEGERIALVSPDLPESGIVPTPEESLETAGDKPTVEGTNGHGSPEETASEESANNHAQQAAESVAADGSEIANAAPTPWFDPDGKPLPFRDHADLLEFLRTARVLEKVEVGKGVTNPELVLLEKDGIQARAIFHDVRVTRTRHRLSTGRMVLFFRDSYEGNVAAFKLSRLMGIENVPPVTIRKVNGKKGSIQLWIEKTYDETERRKRGAERALPVAVRRRISDMWVFDNLINNIDRNQGNMLYDSVGGFWWIDHTRTFSRFDRLPLPERIKRCSQSLFAALRSLDKAEVEETLSEYLSKSEIESLFKRRDELVEVLEAKVAERGEDSVLFRYGAPDDAVEVSYGDPDIPASPEEDG